jgi:hypothetical protein
VIARKRTFAARGKLAPMIGISSPRFCRRTNSPGAMRRIITLMIFASPLVSGCDAWLNRRIDITAPVADSFSISGSSSFGLTRAVRQYADTHGLACSESNELPIECFKQPVRIWAVSTENGAVVCYTASGIAFEQTKYAARADELQKVLGESFSVGSVSSNVGRCPQPPSFSRRGGT